MSSDEDASFGPPLPPDFHGAGPSAVKRARTVSSGTSDSESDSSDSEDDRPHKSAKSRPSKPLIGPLMPDASNMSNSPASSFGPDLPPDMKSVSYQGCGPRLPSGAHRAEEEEEDDDDEDDCGFGPRPPVPELTWNPSAAQEFEERAKKMKQKLTHTDQSDDPKRESWMTELPSVGVRKHMGLQARKLTSGASVKYEDQSVWTDTPADRDRKAQEAREGRGKKPMSEEDAVLSARDQLFREQVTEYNKEERGDSLLDMHLRKLIKKEKKGEKKSKKKEKKKAKLKEHKEKKKKKKKSEEEEDPPERRPFDRDSDLQVNRFDNAKKNALIKRSQELNTRFGTAASGEFL